MDLLRRARLLACLVLAWFALSVGVAIAAPAMQPGPADAVCSGAGTLHAGDADQSGAPAGQAHAHECGLCGIAGAPPTMAGVAIQEAPTHAPTLPVALPPGTRSPAPFSSRAPPAL